MQLLKPGLVHSTLQNFIEDEEKDDNIDNVYDL